MNRFYLYRASVLTHNTSLLVCPYGHGSQGELITGLACVSCHLFEGRVMSKSRQASLDIGKYPVSIS